MSRQESAAKDTNPASTPNSPGSVLPPHHTPRVAAHAHGPFIDPELVTPTEWKWRNVRTYVVRAANGHDYRCIRVSAGGVQIGYWAVELLGVPLFGRDDL